MTTKTISKLLIAALLAGCAVAYANETPIRATMEDRGSVTQFKLGDLDCALDNGQLRCTSK